MSFAAGRKRGLTLVEVLVIAMVIAIFASMVVPASSGKKDRVRRIQCVNNLKQASMAYRHIWSFTDGKSPMYVWTNRTIQFASGPNAFRHFLVMSNELLTPKILICPADSARIQATTFNPRPLAEEIPFLSNSNLSYFVGLDADETHPDSLLTGDRNITNGLLLKNAVLELTTTRPATWTSETHNRVGNILFGDGSVRQERTVTLTASTDPPAFTNRLLMPVLGP